MRQWVLKPSLGTSRRPAGVRCVRHTHTDDMAAAAAAAVLAVGTGMGTSIGMSAGMTSLMGVGVNGGHRAALTGW